MTATAPPHATPQGIEALIERFEPSVIDVPAGRARIRLEVTGDGAWDALVSGKRVRLRPADGGEPDALLAADEATWRRIGADLRGGMAAFRSGGLRVRRNLHLGVGFLAATNGADQPDRLRFERVRTREGQLSILEAGSGPPLICTHGLGGPK
ncbi:MAG TPA: SCP2 sterol-binding domain-containing protein, partial [Thermoleophilaceae bacterium]|nr:SCP2 sterol-binding domain-containing protein [Thermoleophilaceae bacterium]